MCIRARVWVTSFFLGAGLAFSGDPKHTLCMIAGSKTGDDPQAELLSLMGARQMKEQLCLFTPKSDLRFAILADAAVRLTQPGQRPAKPVEVDTTANAYTEEGRARRRSIAIRLASTGGTVDMFARTVGLTRRGAIDWLSDHAPDAHSALISASHPNTLDRIQRLARLLAVQAGVEAGYSRAQIAARLKISANRLRVWLDLWAPEGLADAIELESIDPDVELSPEYAMYAA